MEDYLVSIIVPIYNVEKYLHRCLDSLINQTYKNLEIILVNDESPDNSSVICEQYKSNDSRIILINKKNGGLSDSRNFGLEISQGDYILFVDSDDYIERNMVENLLNVVVSENLDIAICGYYADFVDENEQIVSSRKEVGILGKFHKESFFEIPLDIRVVGILGYAWNKLYKRSIIERCSLRFVKDLSLVEDIVFNEKYLSNCDTIAFIDEAYVHYMQRSRKTLGSKFYYNYYDLKKIAITSVENILKEWKKSREEVDNIKNEMNFDAIKATVKSLSVSTNYGQKEKVKYLKLLLEDDELKVSLQRFNPKDKKDKIIKFLLIKQQLRLLVAIYQIKEK